MKKFILVYMMICIGLLHWEKALENTLHILFQVLPHHIIYFLHIGPLLP